MYCKKGSGIKKVYGVGCNSQGAKPGGMLVYEKAELLTIAALQNVPREHVAEFPFTPPREQGSLVVTPTAWTGSRLFWFVLGAAVM